MTQSAAGPSTKRGNPKEGFFEIGELDFFSFLFFFFFFFVVVGSS